MNSKIMQVFFGEDCLPYKDVERTIHYPIVGNAISGSSNVNEIRFYTHRIGGATNTTWVAISKLPNGKTSSEILSTVVEDTELGEYYVVFNLTSYYTQLKGDLFISLQGFQNGVTFTLVNDVYQLSGTPTVQATGSIKIPINYAPVVHNYELPPDQLTQILAYFSSYNPTINSIVVLLNTSVDISGYDEGQVFFVKSDGAFYRKNAMGTLTLENKIKARVVAAADEYRLSDYAVLDQDENGDTVIACASGQKVVYKGSEIANKEYTDENFADSVNVNLYPSTTDLKIEIELVNKNNQTLGTKVFYIHQASYTTAGVIRGSDKQKLDNVPNNTNYQLGLKIDKASIADNLTTDDATKVLSAKQGKNLQDNKVGKTTTIMGIDLADNITRSEIITAIGEATQSLSGVMSATDKARLDALHALLNEGSANDVVDSINEVLAIFNNYPEGADLVGALAGKVDKENGMGLSHNDYSDTEKGKVTTAHNHSQATGNPHATKFSELNDKPNTLSGYGITDAYTKAYIDSLKDMNGWESELITETPLTNGQTVTKVTLQAFDVIKLLVHETSGHTVDTDSFETSIGLVDGYIYKLFDDVDCTFTIGATNCTFNAPAGYELQIIGQKYTEFDDELDEESTNAVQNKVIKEALDLKADVSAINVIADEDNNKNYTYQIKIQNGKPVLILEESI